MTVRDFITQHYRHFNAATVVDAARAWEEHLDGGGQMLLTLAGAMSTAELGLSLAEMIRRDKVHAICCTGANLEEEATRAIEHVVIELWRRAESRGERYFPHRFLYQAILEGLLQGSHQIDPANSWMVAAAEKNLPVFVPGWEDSTLGNIHAARLIDGTLTDRTTDRSGIEYMIELASWGWWVRNS